MYQISAALQQAIAAGNKQRVLLEFGSRSFSNEGVSVSSGLSLREAFCDETDIAIGQCLSAELEVTLLNDQYQLQNFEFGTFTAWLGAAVTGVVTGKTKTFVENGKSVTYAFAPLGTFIATKPDVLTQKKITLTANDQMILFDKDMPDATTLGIEYPTTVGVIFQKLCNYVGVQAASYTFLNSDADVVEEPEQFSTSTMREVLGWIAEAACSNARFNRDGKLAFTWFNATGRTYTAHDTAEFTPTWYTVAPINGLHIRNQNSSAEIVLGQNSNNYMIQDNPFLRKPDDTLEITKDPESINTTAGVHVSFLCQAKGEGLIYQWQEGTDGAFADSTREGAASTVLQFTTEDAETDYSIQFRCVVKDRYNNSVTSTVATLTVTIFAEKTAEEAEADAQEKWPDLYDDSGEIPV